MLHWDAQAIVLSGADSRDDKIIRLLLETDELVPAIVRFARKGGKSPRSSKMGKIQPLTAVHVTLRAKPAGELALLETVSIEAPHPVVKGDLVRYALATTMAEVVLMLVPDRGREPGVHDLLDRALSRLDDPAAKVGEELLVLFELRMLDLSGVLPPLDSISELPSAAREALQDWREGRFSALSPNELRQAARFLERSLSSAAGRPLVSRGFLDQVLGS